MRSYALIVNPSAGKGRALRKAEVIRRRLTDSSSVELLRTTHRGTAIRLAAEAARRVDRVIAIGGDGTLNEVLCGFMTSGLGPAQLPELGFLPAGTANAAASAFRLRSDPVAVAAALATAESRPLDVGIVRHGGGERAFLLWFGAGWDAVIIHALNAARVGLMGLSGLVGQMPEVLRTIARYEQPRISAEVDGSLFGAYSGVIVANVGEIAFGGRVTGAADPGDGRFDVVGVPRTSVPGLIGLGLRMLTSNLTRSSVVNHRLGGRVTLEADGDVPFQLDGEPVGVLPATVTLLPAAVRLLET